MREGHLKLAQGLEVVEAAVAHTPMRNMPGILRGLGEKFGTTMTTPVKKEMKREQPEAPPPPTAGPSVVKKEPEEEGGFHVVGEVELPQGAAGESLPSLLAPVKLEPGVVYEPITVRLGPKKYEYKCPLCPVPLTTVSKNAMRGHINEIHMGIALLCSMCDFSCYNPDRLAAHEKKPHP
jgi:hypothetical protein